MDTLAGAERLAHLLASSFVLVGLYVASEREQSDPRLRGALVCPAPHTSAPHTVERGALGMVE